MMVEGGGNEISEDDFLGAVEFAHGEIKKIIKAIDQLAKKFGKSKREYPVSAVDEHLGAWVRKAFAKDVAKAMRTVDKQKRELAFGALTVEESALARCGKKDENVKALLENPTSFERVQQDRQVHGRGRVAHHGRRRKNPARRPQTRRSSADLV